MVVDGLGRAVLLDVAAVHQHHLVGHFQRLFLVMGDEHAGHVQFIVQAAQPAAQLLAHLGVERAEGFVEQQHLGLHRQRAGQRDALALAAGQLRRVAVGQPVELHQLQQRTHLVADLRFARALGARLDAQAEGHVLEHAHMLEQRVVLEHKAHLALAHMLVRGIAPGQHDLARIGALQAGDDAQQRGLAAAGRPQQRGQLAFVEIERDVVQRDKVAKALLYVLDLDAHDACPCKLASGRSGAASSVSLRARNSTSVLMPSVTSASSVSSEATAKAAAKLYSL
ncbi:hypothetical protein D3C72_1483940 [compost metagenome]